MPQLTSGERAPWTVEPRSEFEAYFLEDRAIQDGWFVFFGQHPRFGSGWHVFRDPAKTLVALHLSEVIPLLDEVEAATAQGLFAAGFVSFDASPAFDEALVAHRREDCPLACFHIYDKPPVFYKELVCTQPEEINWVPELGEDQFLEKCREVKRHLAEGDTYQVNLSLRFEGRHSVPLASVFASLAMEDPPPYASLFLSRHVEVASLSPELFFERSGSSIRCRPMKGTAPLGKHPAETKANADRLHNSEKDRAENLMILDMIRNDLGRIAQMGSVKATSIFEVEEFPTVLQMTSTVEAEVLLSLRRVFEALFPCASIVGAPKVQTMKIIRELEQSPRGAYCGAIGMVLPGEEAKFAVGIRTIFHKPGSETSTYGAGSGIVWDSIPEAEWCETMLKTEALRRPGVDWELIETFRWPSPNLLGLHMDRVEGTAEKLGVLFDREEALKAIRAFVKGDGPYRMRLLLNRQGRVRLESEPFVPPSDILVAKLAKTPVRSEDPSLLVKSNRRAIYNRGLSEAGVDEVLLWNEYGEITEFAKGNIVVKIDGKFIVPPVDCGLLPGVFRRVLLRSSDVEIRRINLDMLSRADEIYRVNSLTGWVRVHLMPEQDVD